MRHILGKTKYGKGIRVLCVFTMLLFCLPHQAFAARSRAGGGELAKFDTSAFITSSAITVGSTLLTAGIGNAWSSASKAVAPASDIGRMGHFSATLKELPSNLAAGFKSLGSVNSVLPVITRGYTTAFAVSELGGAIGAIGVYKGWKPSQIYLASTILGSAVGAGLNPSLSLGDAMSKATNESAFPAIAKGFTTGLAGGVAKGAIIYSMDRSRIDKGKDPRIGTQLLAMTGEMFTTSLARTAFDPKTKGAYVERLKPVEGAGNSKMWETANPNSLAPIEGISEEQLLREGFGDSLYNYPADIGLIAPGEQPTSATLKGLYEKDLVFVGKKGGMNEFLLPMGKDVAMSVDSSKQHFIRMTDEQVMFAETMMPSPEGSLFVRTRSPMGSEVSSRLFTRPFIDTANQWPAIAGRGLTLLATKNIKGDWKPLAQNVMSGVMSPLLDDFANIYGLKPSQFSNYDVNHGYAPALQIQRFSLFEEARNNRTINVVNSAVQNINTSDLKHLTPAQLTIIADKLKLSQEDRVEIASAYNDGIKQLSSSKSNVDLTDKDYRRALASAVSEVVDRKVRGDFQNYTGAGLFNNVGAYEARGGSRAGVLGYKVSSALKTDLPIALVSGLVEMGTDSLSKKSSSAALIGSFSGVVVSSALRGTVWYQSNKDRLAQERMDIASGQRSPYIIASEVNYGDNQLELVRARAQGNLPLITKENMRAIVKTEISGQKGNIIPREDLVKTINVLAGALPGINKDELLNNPEKLAYVRDNLNSITGEENKKIQVEEARKIIDAYQLEVDPSVQDDLNRGDIGSAQEKMLKAVKGTSEGAFSNKTLILDNKQLSYTKDAKPATAADLQKQIESLNSLESAAFKSKEFSEATQMLQQNLRTFVTLADVPSPDAKYVAPVSNNPTAVSTATIYAIRNNDGVTMTSDTGIFPNGMRVIKEPKLELVDGKIFQAATYKVVDRDGNLTNLIGQEWNVANVPSRGETIGNSIKQGVFEYGWQSLAMGRPYVINPRNFSTLRWHNYNETLGTFAQAGTRPGGMIGMMKDQALQSAQSTISGNLLSTLSNTGLGQKIGLSAFYPVKGYKNMPFTIVSDINMGDNSSETSFYDSFPYPRLSPVKGNIFSKVKLQKDLTDSGYMKQRIYDPYNKVNTPDIAK